MPFHIEVNGSAGHARSFNLTEEELRQTVVEPWLDNRPILLGDRQWKPDESRLRILEGPVLSNPELSFGQGWANAERGSETVTERVVDAAVAVRRQGSTGPAGIVIETDNPVNTLAGLVAGQQTQSVGIDALRERIDGGDPSIAAVILVVQRD
jgi:hypothetical protein